MSTLISTWYDRPPTAIEHATYPYTLGVEVELENILYHTPLPDNYRSYWTLHEDGSLRDGQEWVFRYPTQGDEVNEAFDVLRQCLREWGNTPRCSTHIHVDAGHLTIENLQGLIMLMYGLEEGIYNTVSADRKWCGYAMQLKDMPNKRMNDILSTEERTAINAMGDFPVRQERYYGLNLQSLSKYGTVEFRYFDGIADVVQLGPWTELVTDIMRGATKLTPQVVADINTSPEMLRQFVVDTFPKAHGALLEGVDLGVASQDIQEVVALTGLQANVTRSFNLMFYNPLLVIYHCKQRGLNARGKEELSQWMMQQRAFISSDLDYKLSLLEDNKEFTVSVNTNNTTARNDEDSSRFYEDTLISRRTIPSRIRPNYAAAVAQEWSAYAETFSQQSRDSLFAEIYGSSNTNQGEE